MQYQLEQNSPQIIGHDAEIWLGFLKRDVPNYQSKPHEPADPKNWYKAYKKLKKEAEKEMTRGEDKLKAALAALKADKEEKVTRVVSQSSLPNGGRSYSKPLKSMTPLEKMRKEHRDNKALQHKTRPMNQLNQGASTIRQAPRQFMEAARQRAVSPPPPRPIIRVPARTSRPPLHAPAATAGVSDYDIMKDREARLQAMKNGRIASPAKDKPRQLSPAYLEDLFDDDDEPNHRDLLKAPPDTPRSTSPGRMSPKPVLKRKAPAPSLFMSSSKKPMLKRPA